MFPLLWAGIGWLLGAAGARLSLAIAGPSVRPVLPRPLSSLGLLAADPALQAATALSFGLLAWRVELGLSLLVSSFYALALLVLLVVDARTRYVYDAMAYPPLLAALVLTPLAGGGPLWQGLAGALLGGAIFGAIYLVGKWVYRGATPMGAGDITLAALMGAMLGYEQVVSGVFLATLLGAGIGLGYAARFRTLKTSMPYGPGICLATLVLLIVR